MFDERTEALIKRLEKIDLKELIRKIFEEEIIPLIDQENGITIEKAVRSYVNPHGKPTDHQLLIRTLLSVSGMKGLTEPLQK